MSKDEVFSIYPVSHVLFTNKTLGSRDPSFHLARYLGTTEAVQFTSLSLYLYYSSMSSFQTCHAVMEIARMNARW